MQAIEPTSPNARVEASQPVQLFDDASSTFTYLLVDRDSLEALVIDPVERQYARDLAFIATHGLALKWAVETHVHADHVTSSGRLALQLGACTAAPAACGVVGATCQIGHGEMLAFGRSRLHALHTPGHTAGSMSYVWTTPDARHVFTGDTLLIGGCGRTDFQSAAQRRYMPA